jgi:hypothetical protein
MKGIVLVLLLGGIVMLSGISIYDIQYTTNPGRDNTYPSKYAGKAVTVEGVVTAINFKPGGFFISEPAGGPWRGIFIKTGSYRVQIGDKVILQGNVDEYFGMTCIQDIKALTVRDTNQPVPFANQVTTGQITTPDQAEAYESTLVRVQNATFVQSRGNGLRFTINDGSGACGVRDNFDFEMNRKLKSGELFSTFKGVVCYAFGEYSINPRSSTDFLVMAPVFNQNRSWGRIKSIYK